MGASVVAWVEAEPVFKMAEHDLDLVTLAVEGAIVRDGDLAVLLGGDARTEPAFGQCVAEAIAAIALVGDQHLG